MKRDYQTHVFTSTYTADVSGVCSALYELGGMSVLHDPSGCNSTYSTHDEPRWFDTDSLMFVSGLDEMTAIMGDDSVLIRDVAAAAKDLNPRFITLCGASIPHIIAFDYRGVAHLIEEETGIPVLPVATDGLKSYVSGVGKALAAWLDRFVDPKEYGTGAPGSVNLVGVTPLDFSVNGNVSMMKETLEKQGFTVNCTMAMGETFESMSHAYRAEVNLVVSSAGREAARFMKRRSGMPFVEGLPIGKNQTRKVAQALRESAQDQKTRRIWDLYEPEGATGEDIPKGGIVVIGEEIFAKSLALALRDLDPAQRKNLTAWPLWPDVDEGMPEDTLMRVMRAADTVIADPLYKVVLRGGDQTEFVPFPHEAYSGRIFRSSIPEFAGEDFDPALLLEEL